LLLPPAVSTPAISLSLVRTVVGCQAILSFAPAVCSTTLRQAVLLASFLIARLRLVRPCLSIGPLQVLLSCGPAWIFSHTSSAFSLCPLCNLARCSVFVFSTAVPCCHFAEHLVHAHLAVWASNRRLVILALAWCLLLAVVAAVNVVASASRLLLSEHLFLHSRMFLICRAATCFVGFVAPRPPVPAGPYMSRMQLDVSKTRRHHVTAIERAI